MTEVVTEGRDIEECRAMIRDALNEMILAYNALDKEIPLGKALSEQLPVKNEICKQTGLDPKF